MVDASGSASDGREDSACRPLSEGTEVSESERQAKLVSLEGYVAGRLVVEALSHSENPVTRARTLATIRNVGVFDLDRVTLAYGPAGDEGWILSISRSSNGTGAFRQSRD